MRVEIKITFVKASEKYVKIGFESGLTSMVGINHILATKAAPGRIITVEGNVSATIAPDGKKVFMNLHIKDVLKIEIPKEDTRFDDIPDVKHSISEDASDTTNEIGRV